jgi:hypothetical protein
MYAHPSTHSAIVTLTLIDSGMVSEIENLLYTSKVSLVNLTLSNITNIVITGLELSTSQEQPSQRSV